MTLFDDPPRPTHLLADPGNVRVLCGLDARTNAAVPFMWAAYVERRRASYAEHGLSLVLCSACEALAEGVTS